MIFIMYAEYIIIVVLFFLLVYILYKHFSLRKLYLDIKREINNQTLDYHIKKINSLGYDFTLKPSKALKGSGSRSNPKSSPKSNASKKKKGSKSFNDLLE